MQFSVQRSVSPCRSLFHHLSPTPSSTLPFTTLTLVSSITSTPLPCQHPPPDLTHPLPIPPHPLLTFAMSSSSPSFKDAEELEQSLRYANDNIQAQLTSELVHAMQDKCFKACIAQPADNLSSREERCLSSCMDKFLSSRQLMAELYAANRQSR